MINVSINEREIDKSGEFDFLITKTQIKRILNENIQYLATHNKNLTKTQYYKIMELQTIIDSIK